ncbi:hypothetical protein XFEB_00028 [Xylella fastidiosa EB92.1]|jgi:hypothetical protein|nr:hypothetical protein XFEB_00028 [Xylella fastidiosa EB92.1]
MKTIGGYRSAHHVSLITIPIFLAKNIRNQRCLITMYLKISLQDTDYTFRRSNYRLQRTLNINNKLNMYYTLTSPQYSISSKTD